MKIEETFELAFQNHKKNNLKIAEKLYKQILEKQPKHFKTIFLKNTSSGEPCYVKTHNGFAMNL